MNAKIKSVLLRRSSFCVLLLVDFVELKKVFVFSRQFYLINTASYGNCFVFNYARNLEDFLNGYRTSSLTGPDFGLRLVLNIQQDVYMWNGHSRRVRAMF